MGISIDSCCCDAAAEQLRNTSHYFFSRASIIPIPLDLRIGQINRYVVSIDNFILLVQVTIRIDIPLIDIRYTKRWTDQQAYSIHAWTAVQGFISIDIFTNLLVNQ